MSLMIDSPASTAAPDSAPASTRARIDARNQELLAHRDAAVLLAYRITGNLADSEDIVQDAYVKAVRVQWPLLSGGELRNWLLQITANSARDLKRGEIRRRNRERAVAVQKNAASAPAPAATLENDELKQRVETELAQLDEKFRVPISLHYEQGLSYDDAAKILGVPAVTLRGHASQGIQTLRERLERNGRTLTAEVLIAAIGLGITLNVSPAFAATVQSIAAGGAQAAAVTGAAGTGIVLKIFGAVAMLIAGVLATLGWQSWNKAPAPPPVVVVGASLPRQIKADPPAPAAPTRPPPRTSVVQPPPPPPPPPGPRGQIADYVPPPDLEQQWKTAADLTQFIDAERDAVSGDWEFDGTDLVTLPNPYSRLAIPWLPPQEYDFRIDFTRTGNSQDVVQILSLNGETVTWKMDSWAARYFGKYQDNPDVVKMPLLANGVRHTSIVEVRNNSLAAYVDGQLIQRIDRASPHLVSNADYRLPNQELLGLGAWDSNVRFHRVAIRAITGEGRPLPADELANALAADEYWKTALDITPKAVNPQNDFNGQWTMSGGALQSNEMQYTRYQLDVIPPEEYDFKIEFTRQLGTGDIVQIIAARDRQFAWKLASGKTNSFAMINGKFHAATPSALHIPNLITNGRRHTCVVCVRGNGVRAYVDGKLIASWSTNFSDMSLGGPWQIQNKRALGLATMASVVQFHKVQLKEIRGKAQAFETPVDPKKIPERAPQPF